MDIGLDLKLCTMRTIDSFMKENAATSDRSMAKLQEPARSLERGKQLKLSRRASSSFACSSSMTVTFALELVVS